MNYMKSTLILLGTISVYSNAYAEEHVFTCPVANKLVIRQHQEYERAWFTHPTKPWVGEMFYARAYADPNIIPELKFARAYPELRHRRGDSAKVYRLTCKYKVRREYDEWAYVRQFVVGYKECLPDGDKFYCEDED